MTILEPSPPVLDQGVHEFISTFMMHVATVSGYGMNRIVTIARIKTLLLAALALAHDLEQEQARLLAVETLLGASLLLSKRDTDPEVLRNQVTSPNGVTAAGLRQMAALDFRGLIEKTVLAAKAGLPFISL